MSIEYIWQDRKRHFGAPMSFTKYSLSEDRIFVETGVLNLREREILLYRVKDLAITRGLIQRIFGVGTIHITSTDNDLRNLDMINIKNPKEVKELIHQHVEEAKATHGVKTTEMLSNEPGSGHACV
jgi:uncharacterized membrane protein YdbT with pleckstrin-like domain